MTERRKAAIVAFFPPFYAARLHYRHIFLGFIRFPQTIRGGYQGL